jgi:hypothetical protein
MKKKTALTAPMPAALAAGFGQTEEQKIFRPPGLRRIRLQESGGRKMLNLLSSIVLILTIWGVVVLLVPNKRG